jgi:phosphotriesterase-related protein
LDDEALILDGLMRYADVGGEAIVDCQPAGCGRDASQLYELSQRSGIKILACTGFHRHLYYGSDYPLWSMTSGQAYDFFVGETQQGLAETRDRSEPIMPGFIKIAAERSLADSPQLLFEAIVAASVATGLAIEMHTERGAGVEHFLTFFDDHGLSPRRLVFCHMDKKPDFGLHRELAQAGVLLEYDTFFRPKYEPEQNVWPLLRQMVGAGLVARVALATDMAESEMWRDPGPAAFVTAIGRRLDEEGFDPAARRGLMGGNIIDRLTIPAEFLADLDNRVDPVSKPEGA